MNANDLLKEYQSKKIVDFIREIGPTSRVELAEKLHISKSTLTRVTNLLVKKGILYEGKLGKSSGGRRPILLHFNDNCYYSFGIDLGRDHIKAALVNLNGDIISIRNKEGLGGLNFNQILNQLIECIDDILAEVNMGKEKILGIGVGLPGPLNEDEDERVSPPNFYNEKNIPLKQFINEHTQLPVILENDASVAALAERRHGEVNNKNFVYVLADVGIGSGIIVNGELLRGYKGDAGEIGHTVVDIFGEQCTCGGYGCLETLVSMSKVRENFIKKAKLHGVSFPLKEVSFEEIVALKGEGKAISDEVFMEAGKYLGIGIANIINLISPQKIILGGKLGTASDLLLQEVMEMIRSRTVSKQGENIVVELSRVNHSIVIGSSALVAESYFSLDL